MKVTRKILADKILGYLHHDFSLEQFVNWAEIQVMEGDFEEKDFELINEIVSRIGLADVRAFGMQWEDCEEFLNRLGYKVKVEAKAIKPFYRSKALR
jgi:hypothetical protein